jgi:hypothetical protein
MDLARRYGPLVIALAALVIAIALSAAPGRGGPTGARGPSGPPGQSGDTYVDDELSRLADTAVYLCASLTPAERAVSERDFAARLAKAKASAAEAKRETDAATAKWKRQGEKGFPPFPVPGIAIPTRGYCSTKHR